MTFSFRPSFLPGIVRKSVRGYSAADQQRDVFESHRHHVFSIAYYMTGDEQEAEAILGSTFIRALREDPRPEIESLDRTLIDELRRRFPLEPIEPMQAGSAGLAAGNVRRTDLEEALWRLPARERLCFLLRDVEGYDASRISTLLDCAESEVKRTLFSARLRLRAFLAEQRGSSS
jgi:RNA polymerase sigma-70 factor (ECF subfamily)